MDGALGLERALLPTLSPHVQNYNFSGLAKLQLVSPRGLDFGTQRQLSSRHRYRIGKSARWVHVVPSASSEMPRPRLLRRALVGAIHRRLRRAHARQQRVHAAPPRAPTRRHKSRPKSRRWQVLATQKSTGRQHLPNLASTSRNSPKLAAPTRHPTDRSPHAARPKCARASALKTAARPIIIRSPQCPA